MRLFWLGQAGFRIEVGGVRVLVDPWVSPHEDRLIPAPPAALTTESIDWLLVTHEHLDHLDLGLLPLLVERSPGVRVVLPAPLVPQVAGMVSEGAVTPVVPGDTVDLGALEARVVPAFHGVTMDDAYGDGSSIDGRPRFVGYVLDGGRRIYHAGDTIVTPELTAALRAIAVDVALLPINGRDAEREARGIVGNMSAGEAVDLALDLSVPTLMPYHWDGFAGNTVPPGDAADAAAGRLHVIVPARFDALDL